MKYIAKFIRTSEIEIEANNLDEAMIKAFKLDSSEIGEWSGEWIPDYVGIKEER